MPGDKLSYMVLDGSRVKHVWSGCGEGRGRFIWAVPGTKLSEMVLVGSRVKHVWSGCGGRRRAILESPLRFQENFPSDL